jgi:hypothetical protein
MSRANQINIEPAKNASVVLKLRAVA